MKQILGLIYIPVVSRSVSRVKEFRRCPEHDNLLAYEGKALSLEEFNRVAPRVMGAGATGIYGVQPIAKLVEVDVPPCETNAGPGVPAVSAVPAAASAAPIQTQLHVEPCGDGFVVVDYSGAAASYMGQAQAWENDVSLVMPFASEEDVRAACPGVAPANSLPVDSGASPPQVETEAPALDEEPAASVSPVVQPRRMRHAVAAHQAAKRAAKAGPKVAPPTK